MRCTNPNRKLCEYPPPFHHSCFDVFLRYFCWLVAQRFPPSSTFSHVVHVCITLFSCSLWCQKWLQQVFERRRIKLRQGSTTKTFPLPFFRSYPLLILVATLAVFSLEIHLEKLSWNSSAVQALRFKQEFLPLLTTFFTGIFSCKIDCRRWSTYWHLCCF